MDEVTHWLCWVALTRPWLTHGASAENLARITMGGEDDGIEREGYGRLRAVGGLDYEAARDKALCALAPYRAVYPEGQDPVALAVAAERVACAEVADAYEAECEAAPGAGQDTPVGGVLATLVLAARSVGP